MNKSASARGIPPASSAAPITRRRQSLTVYETAGPGRQPRPSFSFSIEQWNFNDENGGAVGRGSKSKSGAPANSFIGRSLRDAMRELARPTVQLCFGSASAATDVLAAASPSAIVCPATPVAQFGGRRLSRSHSPASAILLGNALAQAAAITPPHHQFHSHHQLCANRSPSVSGASIAPGMGGRRGSERVGRLERSNSLLGGRGGGGSSHLPFLPELSPQQVANLRRSWKHVNTKGLYDVIRRAFRRVESSNGNARAAFRQNDPPSPSGKESMAHPPGGGAQRQKQQTTGTTGAPMGGAGAAACGVMEHTRYFLALLDRIIDGDQEDAERELRLVGARHVPTFELFGLGVAELERLGEAVAESFFKLDGIRQSKETTKVWRTLIAHIIDHIRDGFETELRLHRRRTSTMLAAAGASGTAAMAMAPLESRFCKRNSVPSPRKPSCASSSSSNAAAAGATSPMGSATFLRTELANLTRKLSNL